MPVRRDRKGPTRPHRVTVRFSDEEYQQAAAGAAAANLTLSGYVAASAIYPSDGRRFNLAQRRAIANMLFTMRRMLSGACNNLNQLTRIAHSRKRVPKGVPALVDELSALLPRLEELMVQLDPREKNGPKAMMAHRRAQGLED